MTILVLFRQYDNWLLTSRNLVTECKKRISRSCVINNKANGKKYDMSSRVMSKEKRENYFFFTNCRKLNQFINFFLFKKIKKKNPQRFFLISASLTVV